MEFIVSKSSSIKKYNFLKSRRLSAIELINKGKTPWQYSAFRMRFFLINLIISLGINFIVFFTLTNSLSILHSVQIFSIHIILTLLLQIWWGACQSLIIKIKALNNIKDKQSIEESFYKWLSFSSIYGFIICVILYLIFESVYQEISFSLIIIFLFRFYLKIIYRVLQSLVFAVNRVFVPYIFNLLNDLAFILLIYTSVNFEQTYSNPLVLITTIIGIYFQFKYTLKQACNLELIKKTKFKENFLNALKSKTEINHQIILYAFCALALTTNLFLLLLQNNINYINIFLFLPILIAANNWLKPYYFDLNDTSLILSKKFYYSFQNFILFNAILVSALLTLLGFLISYIFNLNFSLAFYLFIGLTIISNCYLYIKFLAKRFGFLSFVLAIEIFLIFLLQNSQLLLISLSSFKLFIIFICGLSKNSYLEIVNSHKAILPYEIWQELLNKSKGIRYIYTLKISQKADKKTIKLITNNFLKLLNNEEKISLNNRDIFIFSNQKFDKILFVKNGYGYISFFKRTNYFSE